ncbi:MAG TPA: DUF2188 domain-containing protein [Thermoanaerobaculia bacterium]|nr:DUF2188 domain-containing protein [Thermoanaerobaculia bacterium]
MASNRTVYHVTPNSDQSKWLVVREKDDSFREEHDTKDEAERAAKARAKKEEPSQVKVHKKDGNMEYESTYGDDPRSSRG